MTAAICAADLSNDLDEHPRLGPLWLHPIPVSLRASAVSALEAGDVLGFLCCAPNTYGLHLVLFNRRVLLKRELYERALLHAYAGTRTNWVAWPNREIAGLFACADRQRLRAAGDPLPGPGPFVLFRGVAGRGRARRIRGFSWTASAERALWFADRAALFGLADPAVYTVTVKESDVLAYVNDREEQEFLVRVPASAAPVRVPAAELLKA
jgi:hypothetical protein